MEEQWVKDLVEILISDETSDFINDTFKGTIKPIPVSKLN